MSTILLTNATVVNENSIKKRDILIKDRKIIKIDNQITADDSYKIIDCTNKYVIPGVIDDQVHFREPGMTHKATIASESRAAVLGGTTSFMDMPNNNPPATTMEAINAKNEIAARNSAANYSFYLGATSENIETIKALNPKEICGVKIFMGSSTGNLLVDDDDALYNIFKASQIPVATHCESNKIIAENLAKFVAKYGEENLQPYMHPLIRNHEACIKSTKKAIKLAEEAGGNLHVLHLSTKEEVELFKKYAHLPIQERKISAEVCAHHLFFDDSSYDKLGNRLKCNPAVKTHLDREALVAAVDANIITNIATDHAPHTQEEKEKPFYQAPSGLPLIQFSLLAVLELVKRGEISLTQAITQLCHNTALRFNIADRGFIREGYWADLVVIDPNKQLSVKPNIIASKCGWSPFVGYNFSNTVTHTIVNGTLVVENSQLTNNYLAGQKLTFNR